MLSSVPESEKLEKLMLSPSFALAEAIVVDRETGVDGGASVLVDPMASRDSGSSVASESWLSGVVGGVVMLGGTGVLVSSSSVSDSSGSSCCPKWGCQY